LVRNRNPIEPPSPSRHFGIIKMGFYHFSANLFKKLTAKYNISINAKPYLLPNIKHQNPSYEVEFRPLKHLLAY